MLAFSFWTFLCFWGLAMTAGPRSPGRLIYHLKASTGNPARYNQPMSRIVQVDDTTIPDGIIRITNQLPTAHELTVGETVTLRFADAYVYLSGLVLLAAWRKALPTHVSVVIDDSSASPETRRFLTNTGFREVIETGTSHPSAPSRIGKVPIQAIL